jgi:hypothetical protein
VGGYSLFVVCKYLDSRYVGGCVFGLVSIWDSWYLSV